jgi:rSAM/selenodomain-associated transferase 2
LREVLRSGRRKLQRAAVSADSEERGEFQSLSIVIPTLNAARTLGACLDCLVEACGAQVIIVDGGSGDDTLAIATDRGATVVCAERGRGVQLRAGAMRATGPWLLFLHADTRLRAGWTRAVRAWLESARAAEGFAVFSFKLDSADWRAGLLERLVDLRVRGLGLPYGDQGLLIRGDLLERIGGYAALPLMEDVDLVRRLGRRRLTVLEASAVTSADRWRHDGWLRRSLRNLVCLALFLLGVSPQRIARIYE